MAFPIPLERPLVALDVETHDKVPPEEARICEIGFHMEYPDNRPPKQWWSFVRPDLLISAGATEIHGIDNQTVANAPFFKHFAVSLARGFQNCDFCGYNINYDVRVFRAEMTRAGVPWSLGNSRLLDPFRMWRKAEPRTLSDAVRRFLGREPTKAHRAFEDAKDALDVAVAQLGIFQQLPHDLQQLHDLCFAEEKDYLDPDGKFIWDNGEVRANFGKHGRLKTPLKAMPRKYLIWMYNGDFSTEVKAIIKDALQGKFPIREGPCAVVTDSIATPDKTLPSIGNPPPPPRAQTSLFD